MPRELTFRIVIERPPEGVDFALQKGSGSGYEPVQRQRSGGNDLTFEFQPSIRPGISDGIAALGGPFVQGPPQNGSSTLISGLTLAKPTPVGAAD
jgi:hypothetical protein